MKKIFPIHILVFLLINGLSAQSGGTSLDRQIERLGERVERLAEKIEVKVEANADNWEARAERIGEKAERFGERMEDRWDDNWSLRLEGIGLSGCVKPCPEVSFLGIETHEVSFAKAKKLGFENRYGSYVSKVMAKSAAEQAGLKAFDYIYGVNEQRTSDNQSLSDILEDYEVGDEITLQFVRKGEKMSTKVKLASYDYDIEESDTDHPFLGVRPADDDEDMDGVAVEIVEKSTAEEMGLKVGDVITSINGFPVLDWEDVTTAVQNTKPGEAIEVQFLRDEKALSAKGKVKSYDDLYPDGESGNWNLDIDWDEMGNVSISEGDDWDQQADQDENRAFIGIYTEMISKEKAKKLGFDNPYGAYISGIIPNSGAERAGLKPFDYIYGFDEYRAGEEQHLGIVMKKYKPGQTATVQYFRNGKRSKASLTFTQPFTVEKADLNSCEDAFFGIVQVENGSDDDGVPIQPVTGSTAAELGLQEGDVITQINGYQMVDWQDIATAIDLMKPNETITVDFLRNGKSMKASKPIKSYAQTKNCPDCSCGGKPMVVIATTPKANAGRGWVNDNASSMPMPRVNLNNVKASIGSISSDESSTLQSKGVQLRDNNSLAIENIRLSPNTDSGMYNLEFNLPSNGKTVVRIYNISGRVLYEYDLGSFSGNFSDPVDISQNGVGSYFLEISQSGKVFTKKISLSKD